jgi:hypothetical protein
LDISRRWRSVAWREELEDVLSQRKYRVYGDNSDDARERERKKERETEEGRKEGDMTCTFD